MTRLVSISGLSVTYDRYEALCNVDLDIYEGDFLGVIGPNGGGKTTLVKAILGAVPYSGTIMYSGLLKGLKNRAIGYLPQQNDFDRSFPISVMEVVLSGLQGKAGLLGRYTQQDIRNAKEMLDITDIKDLANRPIGELSGGQMQRTLLCRAIVSQPKLLILDEPANFVDNKFEKELYEILSKLNERMAIIMVSHDLGTITSVVKGIVCVNRHVHRHNSNIITAEQLQNYDCPMQLISHGEIPHTILDKHI